MSEILNNATVFIVTKNSNSVFTEENVVLITTDFATAKETAIKNTMHKIWRLSANGPLEVDLLKACPTCGKEL